MVDRWDGQGEGRVVVGPRLRRLLAVVFVLVALLAWNSIYLAIVTYREWRSGVSYQGGGYLYLFLAHLVLGAALVVPVVVFATVHMRNAWGSPNRRAVKAGLGLFACALAVIVTGIALMRIDPFVIRDPGLRRACYWLHVVVPLVCAWLFLLHRLVGPALRWRRGLAVAAVVTVLGATAGIAARPVVVLSDLTGETETPFSPSLARTADGSPIAEEALLQDGYCADCHADVYRQWQEGIHRFSSFNNPAYLFSVRETHEVDVARGGDGTVARLCAGCHDPVPLLSGTFDTLNLEQADGPLAKAGVTCTVCHAITRINSPRGNGDFTFTAPEHYPFTSSHNPFLRWVNHELVKAKPAFHKQTFLKPLHRSAEFCSVCHKVHLPEVLNGYKWLRGQDHYDAFLLSGVSGHSPASFYYPPKAKKSCAECHMPPVASDDFGAVPMDDSGVLKVHDHRFVAANTAVPRLLGLPETVVERARDFLDGALRVDLFALRAGGTVDGPVLGPLRPGLPAVTPGRSYLLEVVVRNVKTGHTFTEGTADSNEVWLEVEATSGGRVIGRSGGLHPSDRAVDPWSHFINAYVLDRQGRRVDRRNAADIFVPLYNHQIPPGAADVVHYALRVPGDVAAPVAIEARLHYRKFDTVFTRYFQGTAFAGNDLPIVTLATDRVVLPVVAGFSPAEELERGVAEWERWNDYGIGLLRKPRKRQLRQAEEAFTRVAELGRPDGPVNLARVYLQEGRLAEAAAELRRAAEWRPPPPPWVVAWLTALVNKQNGYLDDAIDGFRAVIATDFPEARGRGFDFGRDYRVLAELGETLVERAHRAQGRGQRDEWQTDLREAEQWFQRALALDPENAAAHYNLAAIYGELGDPSQADLHRQLHDTYRRDDNGRERAVQLQRRANPAADHAADPVVIYDLARPDAYPLSVNDAARTATPAGAAPG